MQMYPVCSHCTSRYQEEETLPLLKRWCWQVLEKEPQPKTAQKEVVQTSVCCTAEANQPKPQLIPLTSSNELID